ncbi:MAG TPA: GNAT family N-acetyltransferase [Ktedonobacterales bacterium]
MATESLTLADPTLDLAEAFWAMVEDFRAAGEGHHIPGASSHLETLPREELPTFIQQLQESAHGLNLPPGYVPANYYWLLRGDGAIVGVSSLRHWLTPALEEVGGHIGYSIRPAARRQGYGTRILALSLEQARARGLDRVLVTCDTDNLGSARVIQRNGGILASAGHSDLTGTHVSRYWIALA